MQTPTILSVNGQAEFVILPYVEYIRLASKASAAPDEAFNRNSATPQPLPHARALNMAERFAKEGNEATPTSLDAEEDNDAPAADSPLLTVDLDYSHEYEAVDKTEVPHTVVQFIARQDWSIVRAWREYLGLKKNEMANNMGISLENYARMEQPDALLTESMYHAIAKSMDIDIRQLQPRHYALPVGLVNRLHIEDACNSMSDDCDAAAHPPAREHVRSLLPDSLR